MENRITLAYKNLAKARTKLRKKQYETLILRYTKALDTELNRIKKTQLSVPVSVQANTSLQTSGMDKIEAAILEKLNK